MYFLWNNNSNTRAFGASHLDISSIGTHASLTMGERRLGSSTTTRGNRSGRTEYVVSVVFHLMGCTYTIQSLWFSLLVSAYCISFRLCILLYLGSEYFTS